MERQNYNSELYVREESESEPFDQLFVFFLFFLVCFLLKKMRATFACNGAHRIPSDTSFVPVESLEPVVHYE